MGSWHPKGARYRQAQGRQSTTLVTRRSRDYRNGQLAALWVAFSAPMAGCLTRFRYGWANGHSLDSQVHSATPPCSAGARTSRIRAAWQERVAGIMFPKQLQAPRAYRHSRCLNKPRYSMAAQRYPASIRQRPRLSIDHMGHLVRASRVHVTRAGFRRYHVRPLPA